MGKGTERVRKGGLGRGVLRKNLMQQYFTALKEGDKNYETSIVEVYFVDYQYTRKICWENIYALRHDAFDGVELMDKIEEIKINRQLEICKHPFALGCKMKWEDDSDFENYEKYLGAKQIINYLPDESIKWKGDVQIENVKILTDKKRYKECSNYEFLKQIPIYECKVLFRLKENDKVKKIEGFDEDLETLVLDELKHEYNEYDRQNGIYRVVSRRPITREKQPTSGYVSMNF